MLRGPNWPRLMDAPLGIDRFGHRSRTRGQPQRGVRGNWQLALHSMSCWPARLSRLAPCPWERQLIAWGVSTHNCPRWSGRGPFVFCCLVLGPVLGLAVRGHDGDTRGHQVASNQQRAHC